MNGFDISTITGLYVGSTEYSAIYKGSSLIWQKSGPTPIDYSREYLTIESLEDNNDISLTCNATTINVPQTMEDTKYTFQYSTDKVNWTTRYTYQDSTYYTPVIVTLNTGQKLYIRSTDNLYKKYTKSSGSGTTTCYSYFSSTKNIKAYGNIMSLCYGDNFVNQTTLPWTYTFHNLFKNCTKLIDVSDLILPATTLAQDCYYSMFYGCTALTTAPELPATTLANYCYDYMFYGCTSLTTAPVLPATTLANYCYDYMFYGCTSLTTVPELPATTLANYCYNNMFNGCTSLTTAPELHATTLANSCYSRMFYGCTSLTTAPELPATTLANYCYTYMFYGCTALTTAPVLPATTLVDYCYDNMFNGCTSLNYVKVLFTTRISLSSIYTTNWLLNVAASGIFVKKSTTRISTGPSGIPDGWTVQNASS